MNQKEREILQIEQDIRDTIENELISKQTENKIIKIKDIKLVGEISWKDKINGKDLYDKVFLVEKEIIERDETGRERKIVQKNYYLRNKCIGGNLGNNEIIFKQDFEMIETEKVEAVKKLLERTSEKEMDKNSLNNLEKKELTEVLSTYLGRNISEEEVEKILQDMDKEEIEEVSEKKKENADKGENVLTEQQTNKVRVRGIQKIDLNRLVDGKEKLGKRLDLEEYESLYVIYSETAKEINPNAKINNTKYSFVGMSKKGETVTLDEEFEIDNSIGNNGNRNSTKIKADSTATRDSHDISVYKRKSNGVSMGCENNRGNVDMFLYQKTLEENENVGIQIETDKTPVIPIETRKIINRNKGRYQIDKVQDEIEEHTEHGCKPENVKDFDGNEGSSTHMHIPDTLIDKYTEEIMNYENSRGEKLIKEVFKEEEVKYKLYRELQKNMIVEQVVENVKKEMNADAEMQRTHQHNL